MLTSLANSPREYAWGALDLIARLEEREPSGRPEAEVWFGDHPGSPASTAGGAPLDRWLADTGRPPLTFLVKLLAAGAPLSIQAHPSKTQAEEGFSREEAAGVPRTASDRNYRDPNHKPELIVALSERFEALAGVREIAVTLRLLDALGGRGPDAVAARLVRTSAADVVTWLLSGEAQAEVDDTIEAIRRAESAEFGDDIVALRRIADAYPGDPGVVVAALLNRVVLRRGQGLFVRAGVLHAYLDGLGVEVMAASDNVLRGGLTPKHVDVVELGRVLDATPEPVPVLPAEPVAPGVERFAPPVPDFVLQRIDVASTGGAGVSVSGPAIAVAVAGEVRVRGTDGPALELRSGRALLAVDERDLFFDGDGEVFLACQA